MNGGEPGHRSQIAGTKPRGRFLALELAQASFKSLKVVVTHDLVTARGGWLLRIVTGRKARCYRLCARLLRRVRRPKRIPVTLDRMPFRASALACSLWCVRRARRFRDGSFARLARHMIDGVKRLP